ncbi:MAG: siphovirus ReqiPepy6 Gp37-like family protein [Ruthenibacterium sp.]
MELLALDKNFAPIRYLTYINLQWDRAYYTCGTFSVQIPAAAYSADIAYIYTKDRDETGIAQKVSYETTIKGAFVQISGFFLEQILKDKIIYPTYYAHGNLETAVRAMVTQYKADIPLLTLGAAHNLGSSVTWQETGGEMDIVCATALQTQELSYRCRYSLQENKIYFEIWKGIDRTQDQSINNFATFSHGFGNLQEARADTDNSNFKNFALVAGSGEGAARITQEVDLSGGGYRKKLFVDAKSIAYDPDKQTLAAYKESLTQKGLEKLLEYQNIFNVDVEVSTAQFIYRTDFDLGDKIDIIIDDIGIAMTARIIAIHEVVKDGTHTVCVEVGDKIIQKVRT